jgi:hypothetical protein
MVDPVVVGRQMVRGVGIHFGVSFTLGYQKGVALVNSPKAVKKRLHHDGGDAANLFSSRRSSYIISTVNNLAG